MRTMIPLLMLVACNAIPQPPKEQVVLPVVVVEEVPKKDEKEAHKPAPKPKAEPKAEPKPADKKPQKADTLCPPIEGETDQQRILRKLDCLIERD